MELIEIIKKIDNHIMEYNCYVNRDIITIYFNYNNNLECIKLMYNFKEKYFFGCDNAIENIMTKRQIKIFEKQLENIIKYIKIKRIIENHYKNGNAKTDAIINIMFTLYPNADLIYHDKEFKKAEKIYNQNKNY